MPMLRLFGGDIVDDPAVKANGAALDGVEARNHAQQVVLPQPEGPSSVKNSPSLTSRFRSGMMTFSPYFLTMCSKMNPYAHIR